VHRDLLAHIDITVCRLRADPVDLKNRLIGRGEQLDQVAIELREAEALDRSDFADVRIDTTGKSVAEVVGLVREKTSGWWVSTNLDRQAATPQSDGHSEILSDGPIMWVCGTTAVGKSSVGYEVNQIAQRDGFTVAFIDIDQVGFCHPAPACDPGNHRAKARNIAAMWRTYRAAGAHCLVIVGPVINGAGDSGTGDIGTGGDIGQATVNVYTEALPAASWTLCRLHAGREQLTRQIMARGQGHGWPAPGDPLKGQPVARLLAIADEAVAHADALERAAIGDLSININGYTVEEVAAEIVAQCGGWPKLDRLRS